MKPYNDSICIHIYTVNIWLHFHHLLISIPHFELNRSTREKHEELAWVCL